MDQIDIEYLVNEIENIMSNHYPVEAMNNDILEDIETDISKGIETDILENIGTDFLEYIETDFLGNIKIDIKIQPCTEQWINMLQEIKMTYEDFICNVLMAVLSEICAYTSIKEKVLYNHTSDKTVRERQKRIVKTKEKVYHEDLYIQQPYFKDVKKKNLSGFFKKEFFLVLEREIDENIDEDSNGHKNPLLKLAESKNINLEHFSNEDLNEIITYYKNICKSLNNKENKHKNFKKMIYLYHLEIETRFSSIFQMLKCISDDELNDTQKEILYQTREICSKKIGNIATHEICHYQNLIYFGRDYFIRRLAECCVQNKSNDQYLPRNILSDMYKSVRCIYVLRDTVIDRLKKNHLQDYNDFINESYIGFQERFNMDKNTLSLYEKQLLQGLEELIKEYDSFKISDIKLNHFIRMYVSDDKFDNFRQSELYKKSKKAEKRKAKNKKN